MFIIKLLFSMLLAVPLFIVAYRFFKSLVDELFNK